jgi:hypothetical protein
MLWRSGLGGEARTARSAGNQSCEPGQGVDRLDRVVGADKQPCPGRRERAPRVRHGCPVRAERDRHLRRVRDGEGRPA